MIVEKESKVLNVQGNFKSKAFTIDSENIGHVLSILRKDIYEDKIMAPIRELLCNAWDANKDNKATKKVEVFLPTTLEPEFRVRDYGKGLSEDEIMNLYTSYGASTKTGSNDMIGCLGIGSKSPFAYSDQFSVKSRQTGVTKIYSCVDDGGQGMVYKIHELKEPDEPSGMEIVIPVATKDTSDFGSRLTSFMKLAADEIKVSGNVSAYNSELKPTYVFSVANVKFVHGSDHSLGRYNGRHVIVMGNVPYRWDPEVIKSTKYNSQVLNSVMANAVIYANIGDIDFHPSRERVDNTRKTVAFIETAVTAFLMEAKLIMDVKISESLTDGYDGRIYLNSIYGQPLPYAHDFNLLAPDEKEDYVTKWLLGRLSEGHSVHRSAGAAISYKTKNNVAITNLLDCLNLPCNTFSHSNILVCHTNTYNGRVDVREKASVELDKDSTLFLNDKGYLRPQTKIKHYIKSNNAGSKGLCLGLHAGVDPNVFLREFCEVNDIPTNKVVLLSDIQLPRVGFSGNALTKRKHSKNKAYQAFEFKPSAQQYVDLGKDVKSNPLDIDLGNPTAYAGEKYILIYMDTTHAKFRFPDSQDSIRDFWAWWHKLEKSCSLNLSENGDYKILIMSEVLSEDFDKWLTTNKLRSNFIPLHKRVSNLINEYIGKNQAALKATAGFEAMSYQIQSLMGGGGLYEMENARLSVMPFWAYIGKRYDKALLANTSAKKIGSVGGDIKSIMKIVPGVKLSKSSTKLLDPPPPFPGAPPASGIWEDVVARYPLFAFLSNQLDSYHLKDQSKRDALVNYIELCDSVNKSNKNKNKVKLP